MKQIAIYGAGGLGREVLALLQVLPEWEVIGFFDDGVAMGAMIHEKQILGGCNDLMKWPTELHVVVAIGNPMIKKKIIESLKECKQISYPVLIHPKACIMERKAVLLGEGTVLTAGCVLTTDIYIGKHVLINLNATVGHDTRIEDYCSLMPGVNLAGAVTIQEATLIGSGANVLTGIEIGRQTIVGAGAVVTKPVPNNDVVAGVPAHTIKNK